MHQYSTKISSYKSINFRPPPELLGMLKLAQKVSLALQITLCFLCLLCNVTSNPIPFMTRPIVRNSSDFTKDSSTLVVTNDGTYRNHSSNVVVNARTTTGNHDVNKRKSKQVKAVDLSQWFKEDTNSYPDDEIRRILGKTPDAVKDLYNVLNTDLDPHMNLTERVAFYHDDEEHENIREESVCRTVTRNIYPREAKRQNTLVYIPNNQEFMQVIQAEICQHPDGECNYLRDNLPYGMTSVCYQKYAYKKLLYLDSLDKRMASDLFRYPSCCACYVRSLPFDLRSSSNVTSSTNTLNSQLSFDTSDIGISTPTSLTNVSVGRSLNQHESPRSREAAVQPSNVTVVLTADKVFESIK